MSVTLPELPFPEDALEPHISKETIGFHYHKHHLGYESRLNQLIEGTEFQDLPLEEIILNSHNSAEKVIFNNAAQIWNHTFYWESMSPGSAVEPEGKLAERLTSSFGSVDEFQAEFLKKSMGLFGSGWVWLVTKGGSGLEIITTQNAGLPLTSNRHALLTLDVWEHAYYLDYQNLRKDYVERWMENLINWEFASSRLEISG